MDGGRIAPKCTSAMVFLLTNLFSTENLLDYFDAFK